MIAKECGDLTGPVSSCRAPPGSAKADHNVGCKIKGDTKAALILFERAVQGSDLCFGKSCQFRLRQSAGLNLCLQLLFAGREFLS